MGKGEGAMRTSVFQRAREGGRGQGGESGSRSRSRCSSPPQLAVYLLRASQLPSYKQAHARPLGKVRLSLSLGESANMIDD